MQEPPLKSQKLFIWMGIIYFQLYTAHQLSGVLMQCC